MDTESECKEWMEAIQSVADKLIQQDYKASSDPNAIKVCVLSRIHNCSWYY